MERPRFSLATMMLSMAVVASFVGSLVALVESQRYRVWGATAVEFLAAMIAVAPLWLPFVFVAFAIGRRQFSIKLVVWLVLVEIVATSLGIWVIEKSANW